MTSAKFQPAKQTGYSTLAPAEWKIQKLKRLFSVSSGDFLAPEDESDAGFPVYGGNGLRGYSAVSNCSGPTMLIGRVGAYCGNVHLVDGEFWYSEHALRVFPIKSVSLEFFRFLIEIIDLNQFANRTAQPLINSSIVTDRYAAVPPLPEQQRIATYLDASCSAIDAAVAAKRRQLETLDALRKSIIQRAVTRGISSRISLKLTGNAWMEQLPSDWNLVSLKRIAEIQGGLTLGKQYEGPLVERPYLRVGNVQDGHLDLEDVSVIELPASVAAGVELRPDDVLMTEGGDLDKLGRGHLWRGEIAGCLHQNHIFAVRCFRHKLEPMFLAYVTAAKYGRDYFEATGKKTTNLACTNATKVGEFPIPLPSLPEQGAICAYLDEKLGGQKRLVTGIESQIATLTAYRKSLIHECVTGQRRITEADVQRVQSHG
jgi:type I restriction enzyme S subunit